MNVFEAKLYDGMLPVPQKPGYLGYYPVTNREEWDKLPDLYKVMEWETVKDPHDKNKPKAVKSVIFDVPYMKPYKISAKVAVHPEEVQKILFCSFKDADCHLYSVCGIELEGGTQLSAKWLQDSISGAFGIVSRGQTVAKQGGFRGFIPECIKRLDDGTFKYNYNHTSELRTHYSFSNPFPKTDLNKKKVPLEQQIQAAASSNEHRNSDEKIVQSPER